MAVVVAVVIVVMVVAIVVVMAVEVVAGVTLKTWFQVSSQHFKLETCGIYEASMTVS